jgi:hypothetical protein
LFWFSSRRELIPGIYGQPGLHAADVQPAPVRLKAQWGDKFPLEAAAGDQNATGLITFNNGFRGSQTCQTWHAGGANPTFNGMLLLIDSDVAFIGIGGPCPTCMVLCRSGPWGWRRSAHKAARTA